MHNKPWVGCDDCYKCNECNQRTPGLLKLKWSGDGIAVLCLHFFPILIFKVKNSVFCPKSCILSRSEYVQPNFYKICNMFLLVSLYTFAVKIFSNFNFLRLKQRFLPKFCISSRSEYIQPNSFKIRNNFLVGIIYTSSNTFFFLCQFLR